MTRLQEQRKKAGMTQKELAEKAGVSIRSLQVYEAGYRSINGVAAITVCQLARALGCNVEDILEDTPS